MAVHYRKTESHLLLLVIRALAVRGERAGSDGQTLSLRWSLPCAVPPGHGWMQYLRQQTSSKRREDIPDILLFGDVEAKKRANSERSEQRRYRHGLAITESKAWALPLDRGAPDLFNQDAPSSQMLRYLTSVENASERAVQWGILTNGRFWRLYFQGAKSRSEEFLGLDLAVLADVRRISNSFALDFLARQKVQGNHLTWFIIEQLPVLPPEVFERKIGKVTTAEFIRGEVLRLTYTAHDMSPFARDMEYEGPPFTWDEEDRRHRRARLDALFFRLYGIDEDDAAYILDTFPIVREQDQKTALGRYLTKDLVLAYMRAIAAGDLTSLVSK
jgi:hypothetical protein